MKQTACLEESHMDDVTQVCGDAFFFPPFDNRKKSRSKRSMKEEDLMIWPWTVIGWTLRNVQNQLIFT